MLTASMDLIRPGRDDISADSRTARVGIDYHVELERHYYSVPYQYARRQVDVGFTVTTVAVFTKGERIASHARSALPGRHTTVAAHLAPAHQQVAGWNAQHLSLLGGHGRPADPGRH